MAVTEDECCSSAKSRSSLSSSSSLANSKGVHYLAKCVLKGSAILQVVYGHIRYPSSLDIVLGKETSMELVIIGEDGTMQSVCEQAVFGTIKDLNIIHWNKRFHEHNSQMSGKDLLVVLSDSGKLSFLSFCNEMQRFFPVTHIQLSNPGNSTHQLGRMLAIDSSGCFVAACAYEDRLALLSISMTADSDIIDNRICYPSEIEGDTNASPGSQEISICGTIWSMCFISKDLSQPCKDPSPVLAVILNRKGTVLSELLLLRWNTKDHSIHIISQYAEAGSLAHDIVEVPHLHGFAFVFRVGEALLMDLRDAHHPCCVYRTSLNFLPPAVEERNYGDDSCRTHEVDEEKMFNVAARALLELSDYGMDMSREDDPMNIDGYGEDVKSTSKRVCSWSWEPVSDKDPRLIFCADTGGIYMIEISFDFHGRKVVLSECLYKGQPCKALLWVEHGYLAAFIEMGDGMVLKFEDEKLIYVSPIQNIAPILDMLVVDYQDEKHDQIIACCGVAPEGSLRIIRNGISVDKLLKTASNYDCITGLWTIKMKQNDSYHSFLVLSFVEETRVLSVGLSFSDVTDAIGFKPDVCTLACGLMDDSLLVQIHRNSIRLCLPTKVAHPEGICFPSPICTSWSPDNISINLGAVGKNMIIVATSNPCYLFILGVRLISAHHYEIYELLHVPLQNELSCISIPRKRFKQKPSASFVKKGEISSVPPLPVGFQIGTTFIVGTHKPSVEVLSFEPEGLRVLAVGTITLTNTLGTAISGCVPQDVRLVFVDRLYVLAGLRNGMLIRFDWPTSSWVDTDAALRMATSKFVLPQTHANDLSPACLQLIAIRRIGITPVFLVPLCDSLDSDIIALSDRPWLLHAAKHGLSYTSISIQPSTHVTPVSSEECPEGVLFVAENCLHLVEMLPKRLNEQKFYLGGTPRKVLYHSESRLLLVMRTDLDCESFSSDVCFMDPLTGSVLSSFKFEPGETGKSMELVRAGNDQVLVIGTSMCSGPAMMPSGEAESAKGRLIVVCLDHMQNSDTGSMTFCSKPSVSSQRSSPFSEIPGFVAEQLSSSSLCSSPDGSCDGNKPEDEAWQLRVAYSTTWPGMVLAICPYLDRYFLASAGSAFYVCGFPQDNPPKVKRLAVGRTRYMIMSLTANSTRIAVGDCRDGIIFYSYHEVAKKLEQLYCDPAHRLTADCILMGEDTAVVSDRKGSIAVLSSSNQLEENATPERNLTLDCAYYIGEIAMNIKKASFLHGLPADAALKGCFCTNTIIDTSHESIVASTFLGSIIVFIPLLRDEYELLEAVQARLVVHPLTAPVLGNDHHEFRSRENSGGARKILDGDMLCQFLELTSLEQEAVIALPLGSTNKVTMSTKPSLPISVSQVMQLLERVHCALN